MVGREGIEPSVCGLKVRCFTLVASDPEMAPTVRFELTSPRLTAGCSTIELSGNECWQPVKVTLPLRPVQSRWPYY